MKLAMVHQLPLEIYPPATNALALFTRLPGMEVRTWTSDNTKGRRPCEGMGFQIRRPPYPGPRCGSIKRLFGFFRWHWQVARELARWNPDVILSIEPHSALSIWFYHRLRRGRARLMIHHHEYYAPEEFKRQGNRTVRICRMLEEKHLYRIAEWISQTNGERLELMRRDLPFLRSEQLGLWPNYPDVEWLRRASETAGASQRPEEQILRLICVGSLSFDDTYIREVVEWTIMQAGRLTLHLCGYNVHENVWEWIRGMESEYISFNPDGCPYEQVPALLSEHDVALVLYKGNTPNFIHNIPNKVIEALACGLTVWYPREMTALRNFKESNPDLPLVELDFKRMPEQIPSRQLSQPVTRFSAELASADMIHRIHQT